ncbi:olfactory receptor 7G1-like [Branchiostoma lanceolatum]|uniref:olfactory receptor 7G1-like n=1 Tax=Branchiostoma lanceolatum TaxID=7740 RepID=UPI0034528E76
MANLTNVSVGRNSTAFFRTTSHDMDNWTGTPDYNHSINDQEDDFLASSLTAKVLQVCWLVPSLVLILGLNVIFILAVARSPSLQKPRFLLPVNLAILYILLALVFIPNSINNIVGESASDSAFLCLTQCGVYFGTASCTVATLFVMAWDRYRAICDPFHYLEEDGTRWTGFRVLAAWVYGTTISVLSVIFTPIDGIDFAYIQNSNLYCTFTEIGADRQSRVVQILQYTAGMVLIGSAAFIFISYFKIYREIMRQNTVEDGGLPGNPQGGGNHHRPWRTISIHLFIFVIFATTVCTNAIFRYITTTGQKTVTTSVLNRLAQLVYLTVPCFSNPMIYGFRGEEVRAAIRTLLRRRGRTNSTDLARGHRVTNQDTTRLEHVSPESDVPAPQGQTRLSQRPAEPETPLEISSDSDDDEQIAKTVVVKAIIGKRNPFKLQGSDKDHDSIDIELPGYVSSPL